MTHRRFQIVNRCRVTLGDQQPRPDSPDALVTLVALPLPPTPPLARADGGVLAVDAMRNRRHATFRAVVALMLREMATRYARTPGGYLWAILEPLGMIVILGMAYAMLAASPSLGASFLLFKATGFLILQTFGVLGGQVGHAILFSKPLLLYPRVTWVDAILARFLLNATVLAVVMVLILGGIILWDRVATLLLWDRILLAVVLAAALGLGVGCLNCFLFLRFPVWQQVWSLLTRPLFLISGVIVLFEEMPQLGQEVLWFNPLIHLTGLMRAGFYPTYRPHYISVVYVGLWVMLPMVAGMLLLRRHHRELLHR